MSLSDEQIAAHMLIPTSARFSRAVSPFPTIFEPDEVERIHRFLRCDRVLEVFYRDMPLRWLTQPIGVGVLNRRRLMEEPAPPPKKKRWFGR